MSRFLSGIVSSLLNLTTGSTANSQQTDSLQQEQELGENRADTKEVEVSEDDPDDNALQSNSHLEQHEGEIVETTDDDCHTSPVSSNDNCTPQDNIEDQNDDAQEGKIVETEDKNDTPSQDSVDQIDFKSNSKLIKDSETRQFDKSILENHMDNDGVPSHLPPTSPSPEMKILAESQDDASEVKCNSREHVMKNYTPALSSTQLQPSRCIVFHDMLS